MSFFIGVILGLLAGVLRTLMPSLGNWGLAIGLLLNGLSTDLAIGFLLTESSIGGLGSVIGSAYTANLSNPLVTDLVVRDESVVKEAAALYTMYKVMTCLGFGILILLGVGVVKINVWPISQVIIICFLIPAVLRRVGMKAILPYIGVMSLLVGAGLILVRTGATNPIYTLFTSVFVIGGSLAGFRPMPRREIWASDEVDYRWAFLSGLMASLLIGIPGGLLLDLSGDKDDLSLYRENALCTGVSEGMGLSLLFIGFGSRDAISSTLAMWVENVGKWEALGCLGLVVLVSIWYYEYFSDNLIRIFEKGAVIKGGRVMSLVVGIALALVGSNWVTVTLLVGVGYCIWRVIRVYGIETSNLALVVSLLALFLI